MNFGTAEQYVVCPRCGCSKVYLNQNSLDDRCAECYRLDRFETIIDRLIEAMQK